MHSFQLPAYKKDSLLILTSFKVMYSFLEKQEEVSRIFWNKRTMSLAILNKAINRPRAVALLRDPKARFISYFKDKFRKEPLRMIREGRLQPHNLQQCQRLWLSHVGVPLDNIELCCHELIRTPVDSVVEWLPEAYKNDAHTLPQYYCLLACWRNIQIKLNIYKMFLIDQDDHLEQFGKLTGIDTCHKVNHTDDVSETIRLSSFSNSILQNLYADDIELINELSAKKLFLK
ncbi:MAG: sulfotransferase family 2 domain-containing protein [Elainella sp. Prado103]|nr:sulfotransferase family 2 domain-containing protein [Elainella sp. Prado103]